MNVQGTTNLTHEFAASPRWFVMPSTPSIYGFVSILGGVDV
jgi:nucleoside-diphosphate-sugar epimerase